MTTRPSILKILGQIWMAYSAIASGMTKSVAGAGSRQDLETNYQVWGGAPGIHFQPQLPITNVSSLLYSCQLEAPSVNTFEALLAEWPQDEDANQQTLYQTAFTHLLNSSPENQIVSNLGLMKQAINHQNVFVIQEFFNHKFDSLKIANDTQFFPALYAFENNNFPAFEIFLKNSFTFENSSAHAPLKRRFLENLYVKYNEIENSADLNFILNLGNSPYSKTFLNSLRAYPKGDQYIDHLFSIVNNDWFSRTNYPLRAERIFLKYEYEMKFALLGVCLLIILTNRDELEAMIIEILPSAAISQKTKKTKAPKEKKKKKPVVKAPLNPIQQIIQEHHKEKNTLINKTKKRFSDFYHNSQQLIGSISTLAKTFISKQPANYTNELLTEENKPVAKSAPQRRKSYKNSVSDKKLKQRQSDYNTIDYVNTDLIDDNFYSRLTSPKNKEDKSSNKNISTKLAELSAELSTESKSTLTKLLFTPSESKSEVVSTPSRVSTFTEVKPSQGTPKQKKITQKSPKITIEPTVNNLSVFNYTKILAKLTGTANSPRPSLQGIMNSQTEMDAIRKSFPTKILGVDELPQEAMNLCKLLSGNNCWVGIVGGIPRQALQNHFSGKTDFNPKSDIDLVAKISKEQILAKIPTAKCIHERLFRFKSGDRLVDLYLSDDFQNSKNLADAIANDTDSRPHTIDAIYAIFADDHWLLVDGSKKGFEDLANRVIDTVAPPATTYSNQPFLMLRSIYYYVELNFALDPSLEEAINQYKHLLYAVPEYQLKSFMQKIIHAKQPQAIWNMLLIRELTPFILYSSYQFGIDPRIEILNSNALAAVEVYKDSIRQAKSQQLIYQQNLGLFPAAPIQETANTPESTVSRAIGTNP